MLRAAWGDGPRSTLLRVADARGLQVHEHGPLAIAGDALELAGGGDLRVFFIGRLPGVASGACARELLAAYNARGLAALSEFHGAYLALVCDGERAWIVRDRLGAYTLSYKTDGHEVVFGEHDADVLELLPATPAPERSVVVQWIEQRTLPEGRSLFAGVRRLPVAHLLELGGQGVVERCYWQPTYDGVTRGDRDDFATALREDTFAAIARARAGARSPALRLSGGLDSACVAAGLAHTAGSPARALSATFPCDPDVDERTLIEATARFSGLPLHIVAFRDGELLDPVMRHLRRWKVPPPTPNTLIWEPVWALARELGIDVLLDGEGGDEAFGVSKYLISDRLRGARLAGAWRLAGSLPNMGQPASRQMRMRALRVVGVPGALPAGLQAARRRRLPAERVVTRLVRPSDVEALVSQDGPWRFKRRAGPIWWRAMVATFMDKTDGFDVNGYLRRQAADEGIDQRHPLLHDVGLFERILRTPPQLAFDAARDRPLLRDALAGYIAEEVRTRHVKSLFTTISVSRMSGIEGRRLVAELLAPDAPVREYVDGRGLEQLCGPWPSSTHDSNMRSIRLLTVGVINRWLLLLGDDDAEPRGNRAA